MADFVLLSKALPSTDSQGVMTQGIGFPLRDVDTIIEDGIVASDVGYSNPAYPNITNVAEALLFLLAVGREFNLLFNKSNNLNGGNFLKLGEVLSEDSGYIMPADGFIARATISRTDVDAAEVEVLVNNVVVQTLPTSAEATVYGPFAVPVNAGDSISARNKSGSNQMRNVVLSMIIKQVGV